MKPRKIMVIGKSKTGKTTFAGTRKNIYVLDYDDGIQVLGPDLPPHKSFPTGDPLLETRKLVSAIRKSTKKPDMIVVDTLTFFMEKRHYALGLASTEVDYSIQKPSRYDPTWSALKFGGMEFLFLLMSLDTDILVLAHYQLDETLNAAGRLVKVTGLPEVHGGFRTESIKYMDAVFYLERETDGQRVLHTKGVIDDLTCDHRFPHMEIPEQIEDPTWNKLFRPC